MSSDKKLSFREILGNVRESRTGKPDNVVDLGRATLENAVENVKSAQRRVMKAVEELIIARESLVSSQLSLKERLDALDMGLEIEIIPLSDEVVSETILEETR